jgi:arylsulfatase A-like enzyme
MRILETKAPDFLFIGLGDTDEHAHHGRYPQYLSALHSADRLIGSISAWLRRQEDAGRRTLFVVTTDHGRSTTFLHHGGAPEAARVWALFTGSAVKRHGRPAIKSGRLADLAPTFRASLGLVADRGSEAGRDLTPILTAPQVELASATRQPLADYQ